MSRSPAYAYTSAPTSGAHVPSTKTTCRGGAAEPCSVSTAASWITGSVSARGKPPPCAAHSMSNDTVRSGASRLHSPSQPSGSTAAAACTSTSSVAVDARVSSSAARTV